MKVLFLDIDGVLNNARIQSPRIDPGAIQLLNYVLDQTGAKVVVSSMWRFMFSATDLSFILKTHGLQHDVVDATPRHPDRSEAIRAWLRPRAHTIRAWAVVDDEVIDLWCADRCIRTEMPKGLTHQDAERLITALNTPLPSRVPDPKEVQ